MKQPENNPRIQCDVCGQWKRLWKKDSGEQYVYPDEVGNQWCTVCIEKYPDEYKNADPKREGQQKKG